MRSTSFGQSGHLSLLDRLGVYLSAQRIQHSLGDIGACRLGDFGCGFSARIATSLLPRLSHLVLIDIAIDPDVQRRAKVTAIEGALPAAAQGLESASLDVVLCTSVVEHLEEPLATLVEIRRVLAPGGVAMINVPSWLGKRFLEFSAFRLGLSPAEEMDDHKTYYNPRDLWPLLVRAGFRPHEIRCQRYKFGLNTFALCRLDGAGRAGRPLAPGGIR